MKKAKASIEDVPEVVPQGHVEPAPVRVPPEARAAMAKLRRAWLAKQPATHDNSIGSVTLSQDEAAALYEQTTGRLPE